MGGGKRGGGPGEEARAGDTGLAQPQPGPAGHRAGRPMSLQQVGGGRKGGGQVKDGKCSA